MDASPATNTEPSSQPPHLPSLNSGPQIRSRITVVCAECKRLKLKCDRRNPCGSCTKRDTIARCVYSPAAAEKVDLHSLNNRLMQVEAALEKITSGQFHSSYPPVSAVPPPSVPPLASLPQTAGGHHHHHHHQHAPPLRPGEGLMLGMRELNEVWVAELDMGEEGEREIKLEPGQGDDLLPSQTRSPQKRARHSTTSTTTASGIVLPPLSIYYPLPTIAPPGTSASSSAAFPSAPSSSPSYTFPSTSSTQNPNPQVTPELLRRLPDLQDAVRLLDACSDVLRMRPVPLLGGWKGFEKRCMEVLRRGKRREKDRERDRGKERDKERDKRERPREIYFGSASPSASTSSTSPTSAQEEEEEEGALPLFASLCAALSLGASSLPNSSTIPQSQATSSEFLYALSQQALGVWDTHRAAHMGSNAGEYSRREEMERVDYLTACLLGVEGVLLRGKGKRGKEVGEVVGKMVNVARSMGMSDISCPAPTGSSWDGEGDVEEVKRMLWWDMVFYDLFISDTQGQAPLIAPPLSTFNHGEEHQDDDDVPSDVPMNVSENTSAEKQRDMIRYFTVRCRLVQLARTIKYRIVNPDCCCGYTLDQAISLASQIHKFLVSLPKRLHYCPISASEAYSPPVESTQEDSYDIHQPALNLDQEMAEKIAHAQSAEICVMAQMLTLRVYSPFLRPSTGAATTVGVGAAASAGVPGSASQACVAAASYILRSTRALHNATKTPAHGYPGIMHPTTLDFYPLEHTVYIASVICAHAGLTGKATSFDAGVMEDVVAGLDILQSLGTGESEHGTERKNVVEALKKRMEKRGVNVSALKRKHDQVGVEPPRVPGFDFPPPSSYGAPAETSGSVTPLLPQHTGSSSSGATVTPKDSSGSLSKRDKEKDKNKKNRTSYPAVGFRVRPGKDPLSMRHRAQANSAAPPRNGSSLANEVAHQGFTHHDRASPRPQPQSQSQAQASMAYRSRSSSVSHMVPNTPIDPPPSVDYHMPYSDIGAPTRRYSVHEVQQQGQQQAQAFVSTPVFDPQQQRQESFDTNRVYEQTHSHSSMDQQGGPYGNSPYQNTTASGSSAGSPYSAGGTAASGASSTTGVSGHPSTPTFGPGPPPSHNPSPPTFGPPGSPTSYYHIPGNGYESGGYADTGTNGIMGPPTPQSMSLANLAMGPPQQLENGMITSVPSTPIYEKSQPMFDMKPAMDALHQHQQQQQMMPPPPGYGDHQHGMVTGPSWPPPQQQQVMDVSPSQSYWPSTTPDYQKYYS